MSYSYDKRLPSIYTPLAIYLQGCPPGTDSVELTFHQIEAIIKRKLPASARQYREWWANDKTSHPQSKQWMSVGWFVDRANITGETVVFSRQNQ